MDTRLVEVQCTVASGMPSLVIVGLPDKPVSEARERVRAALTEIAVALPSKRITVKLSPAGMPQSRVALRHPIALALLAAIEVLPREQVARLVALGELSLGGALVPVIGALPAAMPVAEEERTLLCPRASGAEAAWVGAVEMIEAGSLAEVIRHLTDAQPIAPSVPGEVGCGALRLRPARREGAGAR